MCLYIDAKSVKVVVVDVEEVNIMAGPGPFDPYKKLHLY